ncbi:MAG: hypothetical protein LLF94_07710 [Chlamydiales bacterium]|nr:hypothetical protein [Chlamydiales bacterium]
MQSSGINPNSQAPQNQPLAPAAQTGWFGGLIGKAKNAVIGHMLAHENTLTERQIKVLNSSCGGVLKDLSNQITNVILAQAKEKVNIEGSKELINQAINDLTNQIFSTLVLEGLGDEDLTDDQIADHFLSNLFKKVKVEFERQDVDPKTHFKNIANDLLNAAFTKGIYDEKLPKVLKDVFQGTLIGRGISKMAGQDLTWEGLTDLFAIKLEGIYASLNRTAAFVPTEESEAQGAQAFINGIINKIDSSSKEVSPIDITIPGFDEASNTFVNKFLMRLIKGNFEREEDKALLQDARSWLMTNLKSSLGAVYASIFDCKKGQTQEERQIEFAENIRSQAARTLPETHLFLQQIDAMTPATLKSQLEQWQDSPQRSHHHADIKKALDAMKKTKVITPEMLTEYKTLAKSIQGFIALEKILGKELNPEKLKALLPPFLPPQSVFNQIYAYISPYIVELITQSDVIERLGSEAREALNTNGGKEIAGWIDQALGMARGFLETKAEAKTFTPSGIPFVDDLICSAIKPDVQSSAAKNYIDSQLRNVITIIIKDAVARQNGLANPEQAIAQIIDSLFQQGQDATVELQNAKTMEPAVKLAASKQLATELEVKLEEGALLPENLNATYEKLYMAKKARSILETIISKEQFDKILPPSLGKVNLWNSLSDFMSGYLKGLSSQAITLPDDDSLKLKEPQLKGMLDSLTKKLMDKIKEPVSEEGSSFDKLKAHLLRGKNLQKFVENVIPKVAEAFIAYHVNPTETQTSEQRTAEFLLEIVRTSQTGFEKVDSYKAAADKDAWLQENGITKDVIEAYRKKHDIAPHKPINIESVLLHQTSNNLVSKLLPKGLLEKLIPPQFAALKVDEILANFAFDYIQNAYDYSSSMKEMIATKDNAMVDDLKNFVEKQVGDYFAKDPSSTKDKTWIQGVVSLIFNSDKALLNNFTTNIYYSAAGFLVQYAETLSGGSKDAIPANMIRLLEPVANNAEKVFLTLNKQIADNEKLEKESPPLDEKKALERAIEQLKELGITPEDIKAFVATGGKYKQDQNIKLAYWVTAKKSLDALFTADAWNAQVPEFLRTVLTKERVAHFASTAYEMVHNTQKTLQIEATAAHNNFIDTDPAKVKALAGLEAFAKEYFVKNVQVLLKDIGTSQEPFTKALPSFIDNIIKAFFTDKTKIGNIRDTAINDIIMIIVNHLATDEHQTVIQKAQTLIDSYTKGNAHNITTADLLLKACVPQSVHDTPIGKVFIQKVVKKELAEIIEQLRVSELKINLQGKEAKAYVESLPGMKSFVDDIMTGLDSSLNEQAELAEPLSKAFPPFIDNLIKSAILDPKIGPIIKSALHSIVYMILQQVLAPVNGESPQVRVMEVAAQLVALGKDPKKGEEWLKLLLPEAKLKDLLPDFLKKAITHEKLVKWFMEPYVTQIDTVQQNVVKELAEATNDKDVTRTRSWVKQFLLSQTEETSTNGLLGFKEVVREIERSLLQTLAPGNNATLTPAMQNYVDATVSQIVRNLQSQGMLTEQYVSQGLVAALPGLQSDAQPRSDMPNNENFAALTTVTLLKKIFPNGKDDLLVPDIVKNLVWDKVNIALSNVLNELTEPTTRQLFLLERIIPQSTGNKKEIQKRLLHVEKMRAEHKAGTLNPKLLEAEFKRSIQATAVYQAGQAVKREKLWGPFKWIKSVVVRAVTSLAMRFSLRNRIYNFVSSSASDDKLRRAIWSFVNFTPSTSFNIIEAQRKKLQEELTENLKATFNDTGMAPSSLSGAISKSTAAYLNGKNIIDIIM